MRETTRIGFVFVLLASVFLLAGLTSARASSLQVNYSTTYPFPTGTLAEPPCPLSLSSPSTLPPTGSINSFFNCTFAIPGSGTFQVYGTISARNMPSGASGFSSLLGINATVVALTPVTADVTISISPSQNYTIPPSVSSVLSSMRIDAACNNSGASVIAPIFFLDGAGTPITPASSDCPSITIVPPTPAAAFTVTPGILILSQSGTVRFPSGSFLGSAVDLEMQQVAYPSTGSPAIPFNPPPPTPIVPVCSPGPPGCSDLMNEFVAPPDPSTGYVIAYLGDVRGAINIASMYSDPTINPFEYQFPGRSSVSMALDGAGNTEITFSGPALSGTEIYCYNGPTTCNNNPHFGVNALGAACPNLTCPTLAVLGQYWTNTPDNPFPSLSVAGPGLTGPNIRYITTFADVTAGGNTIGQWFSKPYSTNAPPEFCFSNSTAKAETLSHVGFLVTPVAILQSMNFGNETPPGQPGSPFTNLPSLNGHLLPTGGSVCFTVPIEPDISVTNGDPGGSGTLTVIVNLNNTGGADASNVKITSIKPVAPATYLGPALPVTVGSIVPGEANPQSIQIGVSGMASGSIARFQISGSYQDSTGKNFQFSSVRGVVVP